MLILQIEELAYPALLMFGEHTSQKEGVGEGVMQIALAESLPALLQLQVCTDPSIYCDDLPTHASY